MDRRSFLEACGLASIVLATGCAERESRPRDDGGPAPDAARGEPLLPVNVPPPIAGEEALVVHESFEVLLNDSTCSRHVHSVYVMAAAYADDAPVTFLGGSHELVFLASELVRLERGERIPFATTGAGPGHGHCGTAWRTSVGPAEPNRPDACMPRGTAMCIYPPT